MAEHIVKNGVYIPDSGIVYPEKPDTPIHNPKIVFDTDFENDYPFLDKSLYGKWNRFIIYAGIFLIVFPLHLVLYGLKIKGKENIRKNRKLFINGAMTVSNHVYAWDFLAVVQAVKFRRLWFPVRALQVKSRSKFMIRGAGGLPIPETPAAARKFNNAFNELHSKKKWIHIFPEACRWDYYEPIRPFKKGAFKMAYRYDIPVIPMAFSYREPKGIYKLLGIKHPLMTLNIGTPIVPKDMEGNSRNEICDSMRKNAHEQIARMAGIEKNMWQPELD
ncbi:lysophospholipid acyltransferase family protein [Treponema sp.]|uniref:lysophospholipid acyltransferase family protein n=1 Tax=Treponema sp. TaxID=166 RepID=UPI00388D5E13